MAKSTSRATHHQDDDDRRQDEDERQAHEEEAAPPVAPEADPTRHPVLEQIFGRAPVEVVPEGQPLLPPRPVSQTAADDTPQHEPLAPRRRPTEPEEAREPLQPGSR